MNCRSVVILCSVALSLVIVAPVFAAKEHQYIGAKKCQTCHKKELMGNQNEKWKKGPHAKAFDTLKSKEAADLAAKKGIAGSPSESEECLGCHVTAYGKPASAFHKKPLKQTDGVQCESCHGPGSNYKGKKNMSNRDRAIKKGMWEPDKDEKICLACHNADSPTWDAAKGFDFEAGKKEIAHPIPEDVKGKYLEIAKQRKEATGESDDDEEDDE